MRLASRCSAASAPRLIPGDLAGGLQLVAIASAVLMVVMVAVSSLLEEGSPFAAIRRHFVDELAAGDQVQ